MVVTNTPPCCIEKRSHDAPPWQLWAIVAAVMVLRALPFLATLTTQPQAGFMYLPVGYNPKDTVAYAALIHSAAENVSTLENPYTTDPQDGRFIVIFIQALGKIHAWTGFSPFYIFELSRLPLLLIFFGVLWRFLRPIFPDRRARLWVCGLTALTGGFEAFALLLAGTSQHEISVTIYQHLSHILGWTTFQGFNNPLWIFGYIFILLALEPLLDPLNAYNPRAMLQSSICLLVLYLSHPYSAIVVGTVSVSLVAARLLWSPAAQLGWREIRVGLMLLLSAVPCGCIALWQSADAVFQKSSNSAFGNQEVPVFWYPVVYGALFFFALKGWQRWLHEAHPWRISVGAWSLAAILLHTSPLLNGYHYVLYLHLPLCIVAAPVIQVLFEKLWLRGNFFLQTISRRIAVVILGGILCIGTLTTTERSLREIEQNHIPIEFVAVAEQMDREAPGNILASPVLGLLLPVYSHHKVYTGQWFLTPDYEHRCIQYENATRAIYAGDPASVALTELESIFKKHHIRYFVIPTVLKQKAVQLFRKRVERSLTFGSLTVLTLETEK